MHNVGHVCILNHKHMYVSIYTTLIVLSINIVGPQKVCGMNEYIFSIIDNSVDFYPNESQYSWTSWLENNPFVKLSWEHIMIWEKAFMVNPYYDPRKLYSWVSDKNLVD